jgi:oxygen-independent coproporphyrinogen-3 oxidase
MASVYFHIPFCKKACHYCDFHFSTVRGTQSAMVECLLMEWEWVHGLLKGERVDSIYFGGGTPSLLASNELHSLIQAVYDRIEVRVEAEITLEVNPDDMTADYLASIRSVGVNRLSLGIQALNDEILRQMNRAHDSRTALNSLLMAQEAGFSDVSVDLMFGLPGLSDQEWVDTLNFFADRQVPHLSTYGLTLEPGTVWHRRVENRKLIVPDDEVNRMQYQLLMEFAKARGYRHYEVSNLARPGMESEHNSAYWKGVNYLGIGPSAHSYIDGMRWWNVANNAMYTRSIRAGILPQTKEVLTLANRHNEYVMTKLRLDTGLDLTEYALKFGNAFGIEFQKNLLTINPDWIDLTDNQLVLTSEGRFFTDGISAALFVHE